MFIKNITDAPEFQAGDATRLREVLHPNHDQLPIGYSIAHARLLAGTASLPHRLKSSETYYFLQGKGLMHIEGETQEVCANSIIFVPPNASQYVSNTGNEDLVFLCIVEPYWKEEEEEIE
ncbi:MAG: cupin domain-containing protein [Saprospiraceae bacterium]|nr:cupin domain-containing protein [Saprospiraceae bacterium]